MIDFLTTTENRPHPAVIHKCGLCDDVGEFEKIGSGHYCPIHAPRMHQRLANQPKNTIVLTRDDLFDYRADRLITLKAFVYLSLRMESSKNWIKKQDSLKYCNRWGLTKYDLAKAIASLSRMGLCNYVLEDLKGEVPDAEEREIIEANEIEHIDLNPLVLSKSDILGIKKEALISPKAYVFFLLKMKRFDESCKDIKISSLAQFMKMSPDQLIQVLSMLGKQGFVNLYFSSFSAETIDHAEKIKRLDGAYYG